MIKEYLLKEKDNGTENCSWWVWCLPNFVDDLVRHWRNIDCQVKHAFCDDFIIFIDYNNSSGKLISKVATYIYR